MRSKWCVMAFQGQARTRLPSRVRDLYNCVRIPPCCLVFCTANALLPQGLPAAVGRHWRLAVRGPMAAAWVPGGALIAARDGGVSWFDLEADPQQERPMAVPVGLEGLAAEVAGRARQDLPALSAEQAELREALGYAD